MAHKDLVLKWQEGDKKESEEKLLPDEDLVLKWQRDDNEEALNLLCKRYKKKMLSFFYVHTGNYHDAEDLMEEAFMRVVRYLKKFRFESSFRTWIFKIANNLIPDYYKKKKGKRHFSLDDLLSPLTYNQQFYTDDYLALKECWKNLSEKNQKIVLLKVMEERTLCDVGQKVDLSYEGVRKLFIISISKLRECLRSKGIAT
ncbi:MAG: RNA polymerase sigma factor [Nitrospirota bacterium]